MEIGQKGHSHTAIDIDVPERHGPSGGVTGADGNLIALGYSGFQKENPELLNVYGHVTVCQGVASIVTECLLIPMLADRILQFLQIVFHECYYFTGMTTCCFMP